MNIECSKHYKEDIETQFIYTFPFDDVGHCGANVGNIVEWLRLSCDANLKSAAANILNLF